ncbi:MAG: aminopeptidase P family protein, partial [Erysipelotrichaceae bacterium]|nr:aminopeptidase P family protein [Erysipelotrichaceae bacterium]
KYVKRFMCDDLLPVKVLEIRTPTEIEMMPEVCEVAFGVIEKAFSYEVITPGVTTTEDIENFMKQEVKNLGLDYWFSPTIDFQRLGDDFIHYEGVVEKGDLLHCDFGIKYMNMCTDTQRLAYLLKDDETELPQRIRIGFAHTNDFQDIVCSKMTAGKTGNDVFTESIEAAKGKPYHAVLYSHPTNIYGHGPGPIIGLWNNQNPIPVRGDIVVDNNTVYALELQTKTTHTDGITYTYHAEETVLVTEQGVTYLYPNRDKVYLVK